MCMLCCMMSNRKRRRCYLFILRKDHPFCLSWGKRKLIWHTFGNAADDQEEKEGNHVFRSEIDQIKSVVQSCPTLRPHESQHTRPPCPSPTPKVHSDSRPSSQWCHPAISSSVIPFSFCPQSPPASESFPMSQLFTWVAKVLEFQL